MRFANPWVLLLVLLLAVAGFAQTDGIAANRSSANPTANVAAASAPFAVGETLTYEAKFNKNILRGIPAAELTMTVNSGPDSDYLINADAESKGTLLRLIRYSFLQQFRTTVDSHRFRALKTIKHDVQKDRIRDSEAVFDYGERRVTYLETDPNDPMKPPRRIASEITDQTHDLVSAIYALRLVPLSVGKTLYFRVSDSGLVYDVPVKVTAREQQKTVLGRVWCYRLEPALFGPGRMIEREGKMAIWITDDARRLPVRSQVDTSIGRIEIKLKSAQNLK